MRHTPPLYLGLLMLSACGGVSDDPINPEIGLSRFANCEEMGKHVTESFLFSMTLGVSSRGFEDSVAEAEAGADDGGSSSSPSNYSTTNVQEVGVDEADMVKTDGDYVYVLEGGTLSVVRSWPVESAELLGQVDLGAVGTSGSVSEKMFLSGDRILVYTNEWSEREDSWISQTGAIVVDISDRKNPKVVQHKLLDGNFVSARMIGSDVYTVLNNTITLPHSAYEDLYDIDWSEYDEIVDLDWDASPAERYIARERIKDLYRPFIHDAVQSIGAKAMLPSITHEDGSTERLLNCTDVLHSKDVSEPSLTTVAHIDLDMDSIEVSANSTGVMAGSTTVYASPSNLYVAQSSYGWWDGISEIDRETRIHRLALQGDESRYEASGVVDGYLHNQFSMSEYKDMLRVATTYDDWWWGTETQNEKSGNNVFILDAKQAQMGVIGAVTGLAPGEQIYATRFQGNRAFMVTFVQVDPLFTLDLRNPTAPTAVGELKIPGYSSYLHPIGEDHILGVGMGGDWEGWLSGIAISLFDISDFADPKQQDVLTLECDESWSEALWDHHAILVYGDTVAIPAYGYTWGGGSSDEEAEDEGWYSSDYTSGLLVASIDTKSGLKERGFVDHSSLVEEIYGEDATDFLPQMRRSLVIEDYLFSISELGVMVSKMASPEEPLASIPLL